MNNVLKAKRNSISRRLRPLFHKIYRPGMSIWLSLTFGTLIALNDAALAARIDRIHIAAMGFCEPLWLLVALGTTGLCSGISVGLSREKHRPQSQLQFLADALMLACAVGLVLVLSGEALSYILTDHRDWLSGTAPIVARYFSICACSNLPFAVMQAQCAAFRADGRNNCVFMLWLTAACLEIGLSNLLTVGCRWNSLEALATAWLFACIAAAVVGLALLTPSLSSLRFPSFLKENFAGHRRNFIYILSIGIPVALSELGIIGSSFLNLQIISTLPDAHVCEAAWAIKSRLDEAIEVVPITSIGLIIAPFIASNLQSSRKTRLCHAFKTAGDAAAAACLIMIVSVVIVQRVAPYLVAPLCTENELKMQASSLLALGSLAWPFFAVTQLLFSMLEGTGETLTATIASLICVLPLRLGLAALLKDFGPWSGVDGITTAGVIAQATLAAVMFAFVCRQYRHRFTS
jgi:Na+-driven multidrug efflux pump